MYVLDISVKLKCMCVYLSMSEREHVHHMYVCMCVVHGSDEPLCPSLEQEALIESFK